MEKDTPEESVTFLDDANYSNVSSPLEPSNGTTANGTKHIGGEGATQDKIENPLSNSSAVEPTVSEKVTRWGRSLSLSFSNAWAGLSKSSEEQMPAIKTKSSILLEKAKQELQSFGRKTAELAQSSKRYLFDDTSVFDVPLQFACASDEQMPPIVVQIVARLEDDGMHEPGIFVLHTEERNQTQINGLVDRCNAGAPVDLYLYDVHVIAGLLLRFLSGLPEPLLKGDTASLEDFSSVDMLTLAAANIVYSEAMPRCNSMTLAKICGLLRKVNLCKEENQTTLDSLVETFGPYVIKDFANSQVNRTIMALFISDYEEIFGKKETELLYLARKDKVITQDFNRNMVAMTDSVYF